MFVDIAFLVCWSTVHLRQGRRTVYIRRGCWTSLCFWQETDWENFLAVNTCHLSRRWNDSEVGTENSDNGGESHRELFPSPEMEPRTRGSLSQENIYPLMTSENRAPDSKLERCCNLCQNATLASQPPTRWEGKVPCDLQSMCENLKSQGEDLLCTTTSQGPGCVLDLGSSYSPPGIIEFSLLGFPSVYSMLSFYLWKSHTPPALLFLPATADSLCLWSRRSRTVDAAFPLIPS